jgi:hypothetical protein
VKKKPEHEGNGEKIGLDRTIKECGMSASLNRLPM